MPIEIDSIEEVFATSTDLTVGLEEEFAILDPQSLDLVARFEELRDAAAELDPVLFGAITGELIASEIEIVSGRGKDLNDAFVRQRDARRRLVRLATDRGIALGSTGTHPWADYREQRNIDTEHYRRVVEGLGYVARRNNTFSLHVHVGARDINRAVLACDRLRPVLPTLLAVSANSPFLEGQDTRLHSVRTQTFTKSFPRCGVPDAFGGWPAFREYLDFLLRTNSLVEYTQVWWSIRPHASFGTVEVRICDAQITAAESEELAGLIVACVGQALRDVDEGVPFDDPAPRLIEENVWRATRYGMDGRLIDLGLGAEIEARTALDDLLAWTAPVRDELRLDLAFDRPNGAQRQRAALSDGADLRDVYASTVRETMTTYAQEVPA
ncbi:MAG: glutamate---cysteine ligase / carboxylate-amine ligase [Solirubrobacteraceae bacterium]|nr:glutamate---cysteine ligase / carboxylate-amine ligase [Solirubrobacteraceae bacterium]